VSCSFPVLCVKRIVWWNESSAVYNDRSRTATPQKRCTERGSVSWSIKCSSWDGILFQPSTSLNDLGIPSKTIFLIRWIWFLPSSGTWRHTVWLIGTSVSKEHFASLSSAEVKFHYEYGGNTLKLLYWNLRQCVNSETFVFNHQNTLHHIPEDSNIKEIPLPYITEILLSPLKLEIGSWKIPTFTADICKIHFNIVLPSMLCGLFWYFPTRVWNVILFYTMRATSPVYRIFLDTHWQD
jgi:hypothetical protein